MPHLLDQFISQLILIALFQTAVKYGNAVESFLFYRTEEETD